MVFGVAFSSGDEVTGAGTEGVATSDITDEAATCVGGRIASRSGPHAVSAGTRSHVPRVTSHTRCREPAEARRIVTVIAMAASRIIVAFARVISIERFDVGSAKTLERKFGIIGLSPALTSATNCIAKAGDLGVVDVDVGQSQKSCHRLFR